MNDKERFLIELTKMTEKGTLQWTLTNGNSILSRVPKMGAIIRAFCAELEGFEVYVVDCNVSAYDYDYDTYRDTMQTYIYIMENDILRMTIYSEEVAQSIFADFCQTIQAKNDKDFFTALRKRMVKA